MKGSFFTARDIFSHELWRNPIDFRLFFLIYGSATFLESYEHAGITLKRGQWLRSFRSLQKDLEYYENRKLKQYSLSTIKRSIARLKEQEMIETEEKQAGTLFTVRNYDKYQTKRNPELNPEHQKPGTPNTFEERSGLGIVGLLDDEPTNSEHLQNGTRNSTRNNNNNVLKNNGLLEVEEGQKTISIYDDFYSSYGRQPTPIQIQKINSFLSQGMRKEAISYAISKASLATSNFNYLTAILTNWREKGIVSIDDAKKANEQPTKGTRNDANETRGNNKRRKDEHVQNYDLGF